MSLKLLKRSQIDDIAWNAIIAKYGAGLPYAFTYYLDQLTGGKWQAIIQDDYEWIMPLPYNRKLAGLRQYYQPFFCQQAGIYGAEMPDTITQQQIIQLLKKNSVRTHIALNEMNTGLSVLCMAEKINLVLPLIHTYTELRNNYSDNLKRQLKKGTDQLFIKTTNDTGPFLHLFTIHTLSKVKEKISGSWLRHFIEKIVAPGLAQISLACTPEGEIAAGLLYLQTPERIICLMPFSVGTFKNLPGQATIIDQLIRNNAGTEILLDFEGSALPGVARFYRSFGAIERPYGICRL